MINDTTTLESLMQEWEGVKKNQQKVGTAIRAAGARGTMEAVAVLAQRGGVRDICYSLVLVLAYGVLQDTLYALRDEGHFQAGKPGTLAPLGALMKSSQGNIPWVDFATVDEGRDKRNDVAHNAQVLPHNECEKYIDAIEQELRGWNIL